MDLGDDTVDFSDPKYPHGTFRIGAMKFRYLRPLPEDKSKWMFEPVEPITEERGSYTPKEKIYEGLDFVSAQKKAQIVGSTFQPPTEEELSEIGIGQSVKVCHNNERFWATVVDLNDDSTEVIGRVDNNLVLPHPFKSGDLIKFHLEHIYAIS